MRTKHSHAIDRAARRVLHVRLIGDCDAITLHERLQIRESRHKTHKTARKPLIPHRPPMTRSRFTTLSKIANRVTPSAPPHIDALRRQLLKLNDRGLLPVTTESVEGG